MPAPIEVTWHNPKVAEASLELRGKVSQWDAADESLKSFAHIAVAAQVGCSFCLDIGYFQAQNQNLDMAKATQVPRWRESEVWRRIGLGWKGDEHRELDHRRRESQGFSSACEIPPTRTCGDGGVASMT